MVTNHHASDFSRGFADVRSSTRIDTKRGSGNWLTKMATKITFTQLEENTMLEEINHQRRRFIGNAALAVASTQLGFLGSASAQQRNPASTDVPAVKPGTHTSFAS